MTTHESNSTTPRDLDLSLNPTHLSLEAGADRLPPDYTSAFAFGLGFWLLITTNLLVSVF